MSSGAQIEQAWQAGDGTMARLIREHDWSATLGPIETWPQRLKTLVDLVVASRQPMYLAAGDDLVMICNDACDALLRGERPQVLGIPFRAAVPELAADMEPLIGAVMAGQPQLMVDRRLAMPWRKDRPEGWFTFSLTPVRDDGDATCGFLACMTETTDKVRAEAALRDSRAWLAGQEEAFQAAVAGAPLEASLQVLVRTAAAQFPDDPRCAFYTTGAGGTELRHVTGMPATYAACIDGLKVAEDSPACGLAVHRGQPVITPDVSEDPRWRSLLPVAEAHDIRAVWSFPVETSARKVVGTFAVYFKAPREATARDLEFAAVITRAAAIIISRHQEAEERASAEAALRETEERLTRFADASQDVLWIRDASNLQWTFLSAGFERIYGIDREEALKGDNFVAWTGLIVPEDRERVVARIREVAGGRHAAFEYRVKRPADGEIRWLRDTDFPMRNPKGEIDRIGGVCHDITLLKNAEDHQRLLLAELRHRVRNTLGVIRAVARRSAESSETVEELAMHLDGRIAAFARVQAAVTRDPMAGLDLETLAAETLLAASAREGDQISISGPLVQLVPKAAETIGLALHELVTNAVKYGALSRPSGHIALKWAIEGAPEPGPPVLHLQWIETGVRLSDTAPAREGFGTELLTRTLAYELDAVIDRQFDRNGVRYSIRLPATDKLLKSQP